MYHGPTPTPTWKARTVGNEFANLLWILQFETLGCNTLESRGASGSNSSAQVIPDLKLGNTLLITRPYYWIA